MNPEQATQALVPTAVYPAHEAPLVPVDGRRVVGYERYAGMLVPVYEAPAPAVRTETVVVRRGIDETAQRIAASGVFAAGVGWGLGQALAPLTAGGGSLLAWIIIGLLVTRRPANRTTTITNHNHGWFGRNTTHKG